MKLNYIFLNLIGLLSIGCAKSNQDIDELFTKKNTAKTLRLELQIDERFSPISMFATDKYLVVKPWGNDEYHINLYDIENPDNKFNIFRVGRGPNEITGMLSAQPYKNGLFTYPSQKRSIWISDSLYDGCDYNTRKNKLPDNIITYLTITPLNDSTSIATGLFNDSDKQFALLNEKLEVANYFEDFPETETKFNNHDLAMGFQGKIVPSSNNNFIYTSNFGSIIKFFNYSDSKVTKLKEYLFSIPKFKSFSTDIMTGVRQYGENLKGNLSVTSSDNEYFMLYSNEILKSANQGSNTIYCFNPAGEPTRKITLDREVEFLAYSKKFNKLYALGNENDKPYFYEIIL